MTPEEFTKREMEVQAAHQQYPDLEIGKAYQKWKETRGEKPIFLSTGDRTIEETKRVLIEVSKKPCNFNGCGGTMELEGICGGCVEGRLGFKSKWTCMTDANHRELSKKELMEWLQELSSSLKA